eukprot:TRINITY_DN12408_c0_g2_i4.p1 TRINITY_DN12408_c0_g2~~TRINITY_DN12408_c0_g2_i4.p1  ORF type:complete len:182 (+),score=26.52 TRINITY_DN12408_c0_g2_i4:44-589(+)
MSSVFTDRNVIISPQDAHCADSFIFAMNFGGKSFLGVNQAIRMRSPLLAFIMSKMRIACLPEGYDIQAIKHYDLRFRPTGKCLIQEHVLGMLIAKSRADAAHTVDASDIQKHKAFAIEQQVHLLPKVWSIFNAASVGQVFPKHEPCAFGWRRWTESALTVVKDFLLGQSEKATIANSTSLH